MSKYWRICIEEALDAAGLSATAEQLDVLTSWVEGAHENYGLATGAEFIPNPVSEELRQVRAELDYERSLVHCKECGGRGTITTQGPYHSATSDCWKCRGRRKHK